MKTLLGHLLAAPQQERDPDFVGTVILLIQHSEDQAFGVVLNRPTTATVREAWRGKSPCQCEGMVYSGGPVPGPFMALHTDPSLGEIEVLPGLYYSVQKKQLEQLVSRPTHPLRIFDSHVGWGPGQMEQFLETGHWRTIPATLEHVFYTQPNLWEELSPQGTFPDTPHQ
jgi:putative transcriptional regulator